MRHLITKIDWNTFTYLFSPDPRIAFQQLAEQLFCFEFQQPYGIYRYYNQPYIETMPIHFYGECVGFQAKYFDASTNLSDKRDELIVAITGAHNKYPDIDKIVFYINKEPGISTTEGKEKPTYINDIEVHGNTMGIQIEWRGLTQVETMLLRPELEHIRDYFFAVTDGIRQTLAQLELHTRSIFDSIASDIPYGNQSIKVMRNRIEFDAFLGSEDDILIVHGEGGCGKSSIIKEQLGTEKRFPVWLLRATDFDFPSIPEFSYKFGNCPWDSLLSAFDEASNKLCIIDSAEKVFTIEHRETFEAAIRLLRQHGWRLIITIRTSYKDIFLNTVLQTTNVSEHLVQKLTAEEMLEIEATNGLLLPSDTSLRDFLSNLFYLKLYLSGPGVSACESIVEFLQNVWEQIICNSARQMASIHIRRGHMICRLVRSNAAKGMAYYTPLPEDDGEVLASLANDGIIQYDKVMDGFFVTHDVFEEIVLKHIIGVEHRQKQSADSFFVNIGDSMVMRKAFRLWLHDEFKNSDNRIIEFLSEVLADDYGNAIWKDEILIALMGEESIEYPPFLDIVLKEREYQLFIRALSLLNTACKVVDDKLWQQILTEEETRTYNIFHFTRPAGFGWII